MRIVKLTLEIRKTAVLSEDFCWSLVHPLYTCIKCILSDSLDNKQDFNRLEFHLSYFGVRGNLLSLSLALKFGKAYLMKIGKVIVLLRHGKPDSRRLVLRLRCFLVRSNKVRRRIPFFSLYSCMLDPERFACFWEEERLLLRYLWKIWPTSTKSK